ncbi:MAG: NAD(P)H-hydrate dehydratase [Candidatus Pacebacteria bacterium]|nr:NAD(P)H-hydrate dehydratase [Candidatus Paceibacterota bacterium]
MIKITKEILKSIYQARPFEAKKYDYGLLLVIGGGEFYTGSPALSAMAAFRAGVDMVQILAPKRAADIIAGFSPNLAAYPLNGLWLDEEDLPSLLSFTQSAQAVAGEKTAVIIGGGLGRSEETKQTVINYLKEMQNIKAVIDADGIYAVAKNLELVRGRNFIFTPHAYEFSVLTGREVKGLTLEQKVIIVQEEAQKLGGIIILKGKDDVISDGQEVAIDASGTPYMTVGGTGDTLAGICGSLLAQGIDPFEAAQAASYINGRAGELATVKFGPGMLATDVIELIPDIIKN